MLEAISIIVNAPGLWETDCSAGSARLVPPLSFLTPLTFLMRLLDSLERRFGRYALRGIIGYIVFFQCIVFVVMLVNPEYVSKLDLVPLQLMDGEWWRLVSFIIVPQTSSVIMFLFSVMIMVMFMHRIEAAFGAFRMNLFVLLFMVTQWIAAAFMLPSMEAVISGGSPVLLTPMPGLFYHNLLFVFAVLEPQMSILLFGIVPLTARIIAFVSAGLLLLQIIRVPQSWLSVLLALVPFFCFGLPPFIKQLRHRATVGSRRTRFKANSLTVTDSFHRCHTCGRTDASDPELDFRITDDGIEYCSGHLPKP